MARQVWADYAYWLEVKAVRARNFKFHRMKGCAPVDVAEVAAFDEDEALVESYDRDTPERRSRFYGGRSWTPPARKDVWRKGNRSVGPSETPGKETVRVWNAGHGGRLYRPVTPAGKAEFATLDDVVALPRGWAADRDPYEPRKGRNPENPFMSSRDMDRFGELKTRDGMMDVKVKEIRTDTEEEAAANLARVASGLLVVDGKLWREQVEPVHLVAFDGKSVAVNLERPYSTCREAGIPFRADEGEKAHEFARAMAAALGKDGSSLRVSESYRSVASVDPSYLNLSMQAAGATVLGARVKAALSLFTDWGIANPVVEGIREELSLDVRGVNVGRRIGDPFAFAERLREWAFDLRSLPRAYRYEGERPDALAERFVTLSEPFLLARELGFAAAGVEAIDDADLEFFGAMDEDLAPSP